MCKWGSCFFCPFFNFDLDTADSPSLFSLTIARQFLPLVCKLGTPGIRRFLAQRVPSKGLNNIIKSVDAMDSMSKKIYHSKKQALEGRDDAVLRQVGEGKDIMSVLRTWHSTVLCIILMLSELQCERILRRINYQRMRSMHRCRESPHICDSGVKYLITSTERCSSQPRILPRLLFLAFCGYWPSIKTCKTGYGKSL